MAIGLEQEGLPTNTRSTALFKRPERSSTRSDSNLEPSGAAFVKGRCLKKESCLQTFLQLQIELMENLVGAVWAIGLEMAESQEKTRPNEKKVKRVSPTY